MIAATTSRSASTSRATRPLTVTVVDALRRREPPRREPFERRLATGPQTSITIGRIIGRRFVRSKKNRERVSRILVLR